MPNLESKRLQIVDGKIVMIEISEAVKKIIDGVVDEAANNGEGDKAFDDIAWTSYLETYLQSNGIDVDLLVFNQIYKIIFDEIRREW